MVSLEIRGGAGARHTAIRETQRRDARRPVIARRREATGDGLVQGAGSRLQSPLTVVTVSGNIRRAVDRWDRCALAGQGPSFQRMNL
jgi:hypothetical protein